MDYIRRNFKNETAKRFENIFYDDTYIDYSLEKKKFKEFIKEYDQRRGLNFLETFPEYEFLIR
jgi:hypothetical protein